ncbi:MAG: hypothetical protein JNM56_35450 [Planctomycetia bacterium]|nr:hypothetical protein [Planctomycetia bacterium]
MKAILFAVSCWLGIGFAFAYRADAPDAAHFQKLIRQLDSGRFGEREAAAQELDRLDRAALPHLQQALDGRPSLEVRRRVEALMQLIRHRDPEYRRSLCDALIQQLDCYRNDQAGRAAHELRSLGPLAVDSLRLAAKDRDRSPAVRAASSKLLLEILRGLDLPVLPADEPDLQKPCPPTK